MRIFKAVGKTEEECIKNLEENTDNEIENYFYKINKNENDLEIEAVRIDEVSSYGAALLKVFLKNFNLDGNIETKIRDNKINYLIHSSNNSILIGKRGHILDALHKYIRQAIYTESDIYPVIILDVEGYKEKQIYYLERDAKKIAKEVLESRIDVRMDSMNSYDRKIVHQILSEYKNIKTESVGEEPNRCVVVKYKED